MITLLKSGFSWPSFRSLALAVAGLGAWLATRDDLLHVFRDQWGTTQALLSSGFATRWLLSLLLAALLILLAWAVLVNLIAAGRDTDPRRAGRAAADAFLPFVFPLLCLLRYVPGLGRLNAPLLLLSLSLSGVLLLLAGLSSLALIWRLLRESPCGIPLLQSASLPRDRTIAALIFAVLLALLTLYLPGFLARTAFAGDQPHYLMITHSLLHDGDIFFENNYREGVWREFSSAEHLDPQARVATRDGKLVPFHRLGVAALAIPFYALGGKLGAVWMIALFAAFGAAQLYLLVRKIVDDRWSALLATLWAVLSAPLLSLSLRFMTDLPLSVLTLVALNFIIRAADKAPRHWLALLFSWSLPWVHARGFVIAAALTAMLLWRLRADRRRFALVALAALPLALLTPLWNYLLVGDFSLVAELGQRKDSDLKLFNVVPHFFGTLFDAGFGLILYNPAVILALFGLFPLWKRNREAAVWMVLIAGAGLGPAMAFNHWWGGLSVPNRYASSGIYLLALPLAALLAEARWRLARIVAFWSIPIALCVSLLIVLDPFYLVNERSAYPRLLTSISAGPFSAVTWWPYWFSRTDNFWMHAGLLALALALSSFAVIFVARLFRSSEKPHRSALAGLATALFCFILIASFSERTVRRDPALAKNAPDRESVSFVERLRHARHVFIDLAGSYRADAYPSRGFSVRRLFDRRELRNDAAIGAYVPLAAGRTSLQLPAGESIQPGTYQLTAWFAPEFSDAHVSLVARDPWILGGEDRQVVGRTDADIGTATRKVIMRLQVAEAVHELNLTVSAAHATRFQGLSLQPTDISRQEIFDLPAPYDGYVLIKGERWSLAAPPESVYQPEGSAFWIRGDVSATWGLFSRQPAKQLTMKLSVPAGVGLVIDGGARQLTIEKSAKRSARILALPIEQKAVPGGYFVRLRIEVQGKSVPAEMDPGSNDERHLGVRVEIATIS